MDRLTRTSNIVKSYYHYKRTNDAALFVKEVCRFFDYIKDEKLSDGDLNFLLFLANEAGIPQYYDLLQDKYTSEVISEENINLLSLSALFYDASLVQGDNKLHRYQKQVLDSFSANKRNRFVLTAPANIKSEVIDEEQAETIAIFFTELSNDKADALAKGFFGIYIDHNTTQQTRTNINNLAPALWQVISEEIKSDFGIRYATYVANGDNQTKNEAKRFLEIVDGLSYLPDSVKVPQIKSAIDNLMVAHNNLNNFYNEPSFARQLRSVIGTHGTVPAQLNYPYVKVLISVFLTNGNGVAWSAEPIYIELIKSFNPKQAFIALTSFTDEGIKSKLQFPLCRQKYEELLSYIQPNITSDGVLSLLDEIKPRIRNLSNITNRDKLIQKISFFNKNYLG